MVDVVVVCFVLVSVGENVVVLSVVLSVVVVATVVVVAALVVSVVAVVVSRLKGSCLKM